MTWTRDDIPDQSGRIAVVTGANAGLGEQTAKALAAAGAVVWLACRSGDRARAAMERIRAEVADAQLHWVPLDLGDLESVKACAHQLLEELPKLDLLINNAGLMTPPHGLTKDCFELQFGINHLGHFALTAQLMPLLLKAPGSRVVTVSSLAHRQGRIRWADLDWRRSYRRWAAYGMSKVANLLFTFELERRLRRRGLECSSLAAHPGMASTELMRHNKLFDLFAPYFTQGAMAGAMPTLRAATDPEAKGGDYFGPRGPFEVMGAPVLVRATRYARDEQIAKKLWALSEKLTGQEFFHQPARGV